MKYDPEIAPQPQAWLALPEAERLGLVAAYHRQAGERGERITLHAAIHTVVENQLAEGYAPAVDALARLRAEGLDRHNAIHAIGAVLAEFMYSGLQGTSTDLAADYDRELALLTVQRWHERYGSE